ncbi:uncharacterized protein LOC111435336 isoform X1 [Cucurbita moschata]|uniref:Uncharacterized protein LOC111435336 isoform X1 n=2 Tax=Cucurbita TaxID=3660 RepID=A0A6J1EL78_CUCMO|nr:uncharacterized protein LOC111435336 isoform X1 [Cucurbita moschata]
MEKQTLLCLTDTSSSDSPIHPDIDKKMKAIVTLLDEDEHYQNRKLEIKYMLEEYNRSYHSLAEKYDCLKFIFVNTVYSASSSSSNAEIFRCNIKHPDIQSADVDLRLNDIFDKEFLIKIREEVSNNKTYGRITACPEIDSAEKRMNKFETRKVRDLNPSVAIAKWESRCNELNSQVTMLMEENLQNQEELARRNNQKRAAIKELQQQIHCLKSEKRALQSSLRFTKEKFKPYRSPISRLAETISNKFRRRGCS